jgi:hypothetical protein
MRAHVSTPLAIAAVLAGGCGDEHRTAVKTVPADQRATTKGSAVIVVRGDYAPDEHGPFTFSGRYDVRFTQRGARVNFTAEVPFTAHLEQPDANGPGKRVKLFQSAARTGHAAITARGRFQVVVDFGDSPYEIRFTKATG